MKTKIRRKRNQMRAYPHDKIRGRLSHKGWFASTIDGVMKVNGEDIPIQTEVWNHETLGKELRLEDANIAQKAHERHLKETFDERAAEHLTENGWTLRESGQWYLPNWNPVQDAKQRDRLRDTGVDPGFYGNLRQAYRMQLKLESMPEVEGLEESLEDLMLQSHSSQFGA